MNLTVGTKIDHERYGVGMVSEASLTSVKIFFAKGGEMSFAKNNPEITVISSPETEHGASNIDLKAIEEVIAHVLDKYASLNEVVELGERWTGGEMILKPGKEGLPSKSIPIETFFHKIVMARDRLRVLEQNINSHSKLTDEEKVHLQQYISRIYGSFTTFNILFKNKEDQFSSGQ